MRLSGIPMCASSRYRGRRPFDWQLLSGRLRQVNSVVELDGRVRGPQALTSGISAPCRVPRLQFPAAECQASALLTTMMCSRCSTSSDMIASPADACDYPSIAGINGCHGWVDSEPIPRKTTLGTPDVLPTNLQSRGHRERCRTQPRRDDATRSFHAGLQMMAAGICAVRFRLHAEFDPSKGARVMQMLREVRNEVAVVPVSRMDRFPQFRATSSRGLRRRLLQLQMGRGTRGGRVRRLRGERCVRQQTAHRFLDESSPAAAAGMR